MGDAGGGQREKDNYNQPGSIHVSDLLPSVFVMPAI
jgi:hypothetical protein